MKRYIFAWVLFFILCVSYIHAQDWRFSQYFNVPTLINPANTGFAPQYDYRAGVIYRNQWASIGNVYRTTGAWGDVQVLSKRITNGWGGVGVGVFNDVAGAGGLTNTRAFVSLAYHQLLGLGSLLSFGTNLGVTNKVVNPNKFTYDNQWNGQFFDTNIPNGIPFTTNNINYFNLQVGLNYAYFFRQRVYLNVGVSVSNVNMPYESFLGVKNASTMVQPRWVGFLNASIKTNNDVWILNPNFYYSQFGNANEVVFGVNANRNILNHGEHQLILGMYYRYNDAFIPMVGYQYNDFKLTFSFDATSSSLTPYNKSLGSYEVSLIKQGNFIRSKSVKCPVVAF